MALNLFMIGANDYTNNILNDTYDVHKKDVCETWTDANDVDHDNFSRTRIVGSFRMRFRTLASYQAFVTDVETNKTAGRYVTCTIWANNTQDSNSANLKIEFSPVAMQKANLVMDYREFDVDVREV